jgi:hypothetical protein
MRKKRKQKAKLPSGFDSKLEVTLSKKMKACNWKPDSVPYTVEKKYNPDAQFGTTLIEIKGRFRTHEEAAKYLWIRDNLQGGQELVFVFSNPNTAMPRAKRRKDGSRRSVSDWADKHGFRWFTPSSIPDEWNNSK